MLIEPETKGMQQHTPQQPVAQVPQIACPDPLDLTSRGQLPKHRVDEIANPPQNAAVIGLSLGRMGFAKRSLQENAFATQESLQLGKPVVAIPQDDSLSAFKQKGSNLPIGFIGRSQKQMGEHARPSQLSMQAKPIKGLPIRMIFAKTRLAFK
ncbi:hypothetical protein KSC_026650 [Ktedonobacter sp. SOSP1-52]|nr:hypothetical protein [Ktedonobacter sp. SOSP1-52]GHO63773.1 hypothetical protein KSC_026650 [Ktedonobacter sp. SOSP1-52]